MTTTKDRPSMWVILPVCASVLLVALDMGDRFWGSGSVTAYEIMQLTEAVKNLTAEMDLLAKQSTVDALAARADRDEASIGELRTQGATLRADVDHLMHPDFRRP
jgi:hypothetical protein